MRRFGWKPGAVVVQRLEGEEWWVVQWVRRDWIVRADCWRRCKSEGPRYGIGDGMAVVVVVVVDILRF